MGLSRPAISSFYSAVHSLSILISHFFGPTDIKIAIAMRSSAAHIRVTYIISILTVLLHAAPTTLNITSSSELSKRYYVGCFPQQSTHTIVPPYAPDCGHLVETQILCGSKFLVPMDFSRDGSKGYKVPSTFTFGTCRISIDMNTAADVIESSSFGNIAVRVKEIINACVLRGYHLGGRSTVGNDDLIGVVVTGEILAKEDRPAGYPAWAAAAAGLRGGSVCKV